MRFGRTISRTAPHRSHALRAAAIALVIAALGACAAHAQLREWRLADAALHAHTTQALVRYFAVVRSDSLRMRYVARTAEHFSYRLRGIPADDAGPGQIVQIRLGQVTIFPAANVRIALGEDLYNQLIAARASGDGDRILDGEGFGHDDWSGEHQVIVSFDRLDVHVAPSVGLFAALGAPESNLRWWSDATARVGVASPDWEFGVLIPLASGAAPIGPLRARLVAPAWGAAASGHAGPITLRARFASAGAPTFDAVNIPTERFVHTLGAQVTYDGRIEGTAWSLDVHGGLGHEEYAQVRRTGDSITTPGYVRRLSPIVDMAATNADRTVQLRLGYADLAPRIGVGLRLTDHLWLDADLACAGLFRAVKPFEHPFYLFITPTVKW